MVSLPLVSCFSVIVLALCSSVVEPHIIGGGWNTDLDDEVSSTLNPGLLKYLLYAAKSSRLNDNLSRKVDVKFISETNNEGKNKSDVNENKSNPWVNRFVQTSGDKLSTAAMPGLEQANPLFRQKREACQIPANLGQYVNQLQSRLNETQFVGRTSRSQPSRPIVPRDQPNVCPSGSNSYWHRPESNLRSNCPWKLSEVDLGVNAYPRYILEATCLCTRCINSPLMGCTNLRQDVTYFERQGCQDGLALMNKKTINVVVGCYCVHALINGATEATFTEANTEVTPTDDW